MKLERQNIIIMNKSYTLILILNVTNTSKLTRRREDHVCVY